MKTIVLALSILFASPAFATPINPTTLIGKYSVEAQVLGQRFAAHLQIISAQEFIVQQISSNGSAGEICNGRYVVANAQYFRGAATCPSDRSERLDFNVDFKGKSVEDLKKGTYLTVSTSLGGGVRVSAYVKKH